MGPSGMMMVVICTRTFIDLTLGSGKSTLLNVLWGRITENSGSVTLNAYRGAKRKRHIGYVFQEDRFIEHLSVEEQLYYMAGLRLQHPHSKATRDSLVSDDHLRISCRAKGVSIRTD